MIGDAIDDLIPIWQGFYFNWSYNHRVNRLGSRISAVERDKAGPVVTVSQAAATGIGPDTCFYKTSVAIVSCAGIRAIPATNVFRLRSRKGLRTEGTQRVRIRLEEAPGRGAGVAVLNGYDLAAQSSSQKMQGMRLCVSPVSFDAGKNEYTYTVCAALAMDCRSIECNRRQATFDYLLRVETLFVSGLPDNPPAKRFSRRLRWTRGTEAVVGDESETMDSGLAGAVGKEEEPRRAQPAGRGTPGVPSGSPPVVVPALRMLDLSLSGPKWMIEWAAYLDEVDVPKNETSLRFALHLFYKAWRTGMRRHSFEPRYSRFALREKGAAELAAEVIALRFPGGMLYQDQSVGAIRWGGRNSNPNRPEAVKEHRLTVPHAP